MSVTTRRALWWGLRRIVAPLAAFVLLATQLVLPTPVEAATVLYRSAATAVSAGEGVLEIATPEGVEPGDLLLAQITWPELAGEITSADGWTLVRRDQAGRRLVQAVYVRIADADEPGTHTWTAKSDRRGAGGIAAYSGVNLADPINDHSGTAAKKSSGTIAPPPTATVAPNSMLVGLLSTNGPTVPTPPAGMNPRWGVNGAAGETEGPPSVAFLLVDELVDEPGVELDRPAVVDRGQAAIGQLIVLNPAVAIPPSQDAPEPDPVAPDPGEDPESVDSPSKRPEYLMEFTPAPGTPGAFGANGRGYDIVLEDGTAALTLGNGNAEHEVRMSFRGGNPAPTANGIDAVASPTEAPLYAAVGYDDIYPGIDIVYSANGRELEYSFIVEPGADPDSIVIEFSGAKGLHLEEDGTLVIDSRAGRDLTATAPHTFQEIGELEVPVESSFRINENGTVGVAIGDYDSALPLIIDPTFKAVDSVVTGPANSITIAAPASLSASDVMIAVIALRAPSGALNVVPPTGWNLIRADVAAAMEQHAFYKVATATEPADYLFTYDQTVESAGAIAAYSGVDTTSPIDTHGGQYNAGSTPTAPSITTTVADTTLVAGFGFNNGGSLIPPTGMTERWDEPGVISIAGADEFFAGPGATGTRSSATSTDPTIGQLIALTPARCGDSDADGLCDLEEDANTDADNDPATNPGPDTDGDTTPNYLDADDDGDGTPTASETPDPNGDGDPRDAVDSDWDGQPDYLDDPTGASDGTVGIEQKISDTTGGLTTTLGDDDRFGRSVAGIGDLDGDGTNDIAVGAQLDDDGGTDRGAVHILFLNTDGTVKAEQKISDTTGGLTATLNDLDRFGGAVARIGDLDGDGTNDIAVGAQMDDDGGTNRGAVHILFLNTDGTIKAEQKISDTTGGLTATLNDLDRFGRGVAGIGDLDGDGTNDIAVGAFRDGDGGTDRGAVHILFLNTDGTVKAEQKISDTTGGLTATLNDNDRFGVAVAGIGDLNNDSTNDIAVGAFYDDDGGTDRGAVHILFLNTDGTIKAEQKISDTTGGLTATLNDNDQFGSAVAGIGDLNNDSTNDIAVGAFYDDDGGTDRGAVHILFLNTDGTIKAEQKISDTTGGLTATLNDNDQFGSAVAGIGDLNNDSTIDIAVGAFMDDGGGIDRGATYVLHLAAGNQPPVAVAGGPYAVTEGGSFDLDETGSSDPDTDPLTYAWDLDGDLSYDDATGATPTIDWTELIPLGIDDDGGPHTVGLLVDDGNGGTDTATATLTVANAAPAISTTGATTVMAGVPFTLNLGVTDPGDDTVTDWIISWGDGTIDAIAGNPATATHTYTNPGLSNNILAAVIDEDGTWHQNRLAVPGLFSTLQMYRLEATTGSVIDNIAPGSGLGWALAAIIGPDGMLYVGSYTTDAVHRFDPATGAHLGVFVPARSGGLNAPAGMAFGPDGDLYVTSNYGDEVLRYDGSTGTFIGTFVPYQNGGLDEPDDLVFGPNGDLFVTSFRTDQVLQYDGITGEFRGVFASGPEMNQPSELVFGPDGHLYVTSVANDHVVRYNGSNGSLIGVFAAAGGSGLNEPRGAVFGPDGHLYVGGRQQIIRYNGTSGTYLDTYLSSGTINGPAQSAFVPGHQVDVGLVVNSTGDAPDSLAGDGICDTSNTNSQGDAECTLRAAIEEANAVLGANAIRFDIPASEPNYDLTGNGEVTIRPGSKLPPITDPVSIDGYTQPGARPNSIPAPGSTNAVLLIEIDGSAFAAPGPDDDGLLITAGDSTVRGLVINRFGRDAIRITTAGDNMLIGNYLGTDVTGTVDRGNANNGIFIINAPDNQVGSTNPADRNIVSGNDNNGILFDGTASSGNVIRGNYFGINAAGTAALGNSDEGVDLSDSPGNLVGGTTSGARNVISGNGDDGLLIIGALATGNTVQNNYIGTNAAGTAAILNGANGVAIKGGASGNTVGGQAANAGNVISGNTSSGVAIREAGTDNNTVDGNLIGTAAVGSSPVPNGASGVQVTAGALDNTIGGTVAGNLIAHNALEGILVTAAPGNTAIGNSIHTNGGLGIDVGGDGVTETGVPDFPDITSAAESVGVVDVDFDLDAPAGWYRIEFFSNPGGVDPTGNGEGESFAGFTVISHGGLGPESFLTSFPGSAGDVVTATTTECDDGVTCNDFGSTSEFSDGFTAISSTNPPTFDQDLLDRTDAEGTLISLSAEATDPDVGDTLAYSATDLPLGLSIDTASGLVTGIVNHAAAASSPYNVEISVCDDGSPSQCATDTFTWTITNVATTPPYLVAGSGGAGGGDDLLTTADETDFDPATNEVDIGIGTGTSGIAAIAVEPISGVLFTADGSQLGILNIDGGIFTPVGAGLGTGDGEFGSIAFDTVVGMSFHPLTGEIWAIHNRPGLVDVMFLVDPATGAHIPDAFGAGVDYRKLRQHAGASEFTSLAMDPTDWQLYGALSDGAGTDYLVSVSRKNGNTKVIGSFAQAITDLSFDNAGQMWAIDSGTLYQVAKTSAALDAGRPIDNGSAYEALAFVVDPASPPALEGTVFEDLAGDALSGSQAVEDLTNPGAGGVAVHIYQDNGAVPGEPDSADTLFDTRLTGPTGHYFFEALPPGAYWLAIDSTSINPIAGGTGWAEQTYGPIGAVAYDGSYQFALAAGPLFGGKQPTVSDAPADPATSEHVSRLNLAAGDHVEDVDFGFSFDVVTNLEGGDGTGPQGSIRRFITNATTVNGPNAMRFVPAVPTTGSDGGGNSWWHLAPTVALDAITAPDTTVDGTAYSAADGATVVDLNTAGPELELTGSGGGYGLEVAASRAEIRDLTVNGFASGVAFLGGDGSTVAGSYLGPDATGLVGETGNIDEGVLVYGATSTVVGGTTVADRNVISGNRLRGVFIDDATDGSSPISDGTQIVGNYIGTDAAGTAALPHSGGATPTYQQIGIALWGGPDNVIGTATAGNIISGNEWHGVYIWGADSTGNKVQGNTIGLDATATSPVPNGYDSSTRSAVNLANATGNLIGGDTLAEGNIIAGNASIGVSVFGTLAIDNAIIGNSIYDNGELGIDLETKGVSANDPGDVDVNVANELLNFPVITSAVETLGTVAVDFELDVPAGDYRIEFFTNSVADPSSHGEGETLTHAYAVMAHPGGLRSYGTTFAGSAGGIVTATTTEDLSTSFGSTSEFSAAVVVTVPDITPPVITLNGSTPINVEAGTVYVDAGATAWDNLDGDLTGSIFTVNPVDTATLGTYTVTYNVSDSSGNNAAEVTRIVNVVDTTAPVITLVGSTPIDVEAGSTYVDAGATAWDAGDGDLTAAIITINPVDTSTLGTYLVTYNVTDSQGHTATEVTRTVNVVDTTAPVITLLGDNPQIIEAGTVYVEAGATATDIHDGDVTSSIVINSAAVDTGNVGSYPVFYDVMDAAGNLGSAIRTVNVVDTTAPMITLVGSTPIDIEAGTVYVDAGATAWDNLDGDLTAAIVTVNPVNTATLGTYTVTYNVTDSQGNTATEVTRTVNVVDTTAPVITLNGSTPIDVEAGTVYVDAGATATDSFDGDLTAAIVTINPVNTATLGTYTVTYNVTDSQGNTATEVTRTVNVIDTTAPVITLNGSTPIDVEAGTVYVDAGATAWDNLDGDLTGSIFTVNPVDTATLGTYTVTYNVSDSSGNNAAEVTRTVNVVDTTAPVITLVGSTPIDVEAGSTYVDAGATAWDAGDGDLTAAIITVNPVDTSTLGTYLVTYNVTDSQGHTATEVTRTVNVVDTTAPVITLLGDNPQIIEAGTVYVEAGATATDIHDGDVTSSIVINSAAVDTGNVGSYPVFYDVMDAAGNLGSAIRTVNVVDTTAPMITLVGSTPIDIEAGTVYVDAGATAWDNLDGDLTAAIVTVNPVNTATLGTYTVTYNVTDSQGNTATEVTRTVNVVDTTAPVITLNGSTPIDVEAGTVYVDAGATATDSFDGDLTAAIVTINPVNTATLGTYTVTYNVTDSQGNTATEVTRTVNVIDTTAPVITLNGSTPINVEAGTVYVDAGATAWDNLDGDLTGSIFTVNPVDTATLGTYTVTYNVSDSSGNNAAEVTRTVNVVDTTAPVITLVGSTPIDVEAGSTYVDAGATAWDAGDGDLTAAIITINPVNTATLGTYLVTYNVTDSQGHTATEVTRTVNVVDTTAPVITLLGDNPQIIEAGSPYVEAGATATDIHDGDVTSSIVINSAAVDTGNVGSYPVFYDVMDAAGNLGSAIRTVNVVDTTAPMITLVGSTPIDIEAGTVYVDAGATAWDDLDGDLTAAIVTINPVNTATLGTYTVTYNVTDSQGNTATEVTRTVNVVDTTAPVITLNGSTPIDVEAGTVYVDAGATATDSFDGDLTAAIVTVNPVNTATLGTYTVTYNVTDSQGNTATEVTRTVNVIDTTAPVITLLGSTPIDVEAGTVYVDAGATATDSFEDDLTSSIVTVNPVETSTLGTYTVTYNVTDSQGNAATEVTRVVNVIDTTPPVITLVGVNPQTIEVGSAYNELGATAWDNGDGDLTSAIVTDASGVDTTALGTYLVTYDVTDANANAAARETRTVNIVNAPPTLAPITNRNVTEMTTLTFTANASDPDPTDPLTYSLATTPSGASGPAIDPTTGVFTWRPTEAQGPGVFTFEIVVTDSAGSTDRTSVQISVSEAPRPPVLAGIADTTTGEQTAVSFTAIASDPDVPASAVTYGLADAPAGASINSTSGAFLWTPTEAQGPGSYTFNVVATDADGLSDSESVMITVTETNVAPVLQAIPRQSVDEGTTLTFTAVATDRDRPTNTLTFALIDPPFGALIDPTTGVVSWTPTEAQGPGTHRFSVTVSDNGMVGPATTNASATQPVTIDVDEANQPPLVEQPANRVTAAGVFDAITLEGSDSDIPTQQLTWSATGLPPGLSISSSTGRIAGTPLPAGAGAHQVTITLTDDDGAFGSATFTWTIDQPLPGSPIVKDESYSVDFGGRLTIPAPGVLDNDRDPDGGTLEAHVYAPTTKGTLDLEVNGSFRYAHDAESSGTDTFTYEVRDDEGLSAYATATITITNEAPVAGDDERSVEEDSYVDLDPVADNDRDPENYELVIVDWTQPRNGGITTPTTDKNILRYKPDPDYHGLDKFTYTVQDPGGATATATVSITVTPLNDAPIGVDDSYIIEDYQPAELAVLANDSDVDGDPLRITRVSGAELGIIRILDHRSLSYDPTSGNTGIDTITYTVIDGNGGTTQAKATILIPEAVLAAGEELFDDVAPTNVETSAGETQATTIGGFTIQSVTLMADAFWQTVLALRVPMFFLLLALGSVIVGGGLTNAPIFVAARRKRYYAGVLLHRESFLIAYEEPDASSDIVYRFQPTARSIHAAGRAQQVDGISWIPVTTANGKGWIDARHLVQEVDIGTFMEDDRPPQLVADFVERLRSGQGVERLLSRPGLLLALAHDVSFVPASMATRLAARDRTDESWSGAIAAFLSAYDATAEISPKTPHSSVALLPSECQNFLYLALEPDALGRPWLVYIEYLNKTPHIIGLGIDL